MAIKSRQKSNKALRVIIYPLFAVLAMFLTFAICVQTFFPKASVRLVGFQFWLISYTGSMEPVLNYNDMILIYRFDFDKLEKGDIITFVTKTTQGEEIIVTHTINDIQIDSDTGIKYIQTKGENRPLPDRIPVTKDGANDTAKYLGKYAFKSEFLGNFVAFLKSTAGLTAIAINLLCALIIYLTISKKPDNLLHL